MHKKILLITSTILIAVIGFISCINNNNPMPEDVRGKDYAGASTCISCHKNIADIYIHSAHHNTSRISSAENIDGSFTSPANEFVYSDSMKVTMEKKGNTFYQTAYINGAETESHPFNITIGSGRKAQTYLYHAGDEIHQLPISYFMPTASWANSPGFPANNIFFSRNIPSKCFGCHASAANVEVVQTGSLELSEKYLPGQQLLSIDCERCHGPAKLHADYHTAHPGETVPKYITVITKLSRQQKMDMCGVCHSGNKKELKSVFEFKPGDDLHDYQEPDFMHVDINKMDVHGNQVQLLMASKCYQQSKDLNCLSCHNAHGDEIQNMALFSQKCMVCHTEANHNFCTMKPAPGLVLQANCIDCHMPALPSKKVTLLTNHQESPRPDYIRTHLIAVYNKLNNAITK
ncbi:MAG: multiheme c-type cytochrome [Ginsengibacter sp.]